MRRTFLRRTYALASAAALAGILGCATKSSPPGSPGPGDGKGGAKVPATVVRPLRVDPDTLKLQERRQHPEWTLSSDWPAGSCMVISIHDDPLEPGEDPGGACKRVIRRGVPKPGTAGKHYKYSVTVRVPDGPPQVLDPDIEVDR